MFCGAGGLSLGFKRAGFDVVGAFDSDPKHIETYCHNFGSNGVFHQDIFNVSGPEILEQTKVSDTIDVIFGGPPCQGFSNAGKREPNDIRNSLILKFAKITEEIKPRAFLMENVSGILSPIYQPLLSTYYDILRKAGYFVYEPIVLNASDYNVPQNRKRVFIIGVLKKNRNIVHRIDFSSANEIGKKSTVKDAIYDLKDINMEPNIEDIFYGEFGCTSEYSYNLARGINEEPFPNNGAKRLKGLTGCMTTNHSEKVIKRFSDTLPGTSEKISRYKRLNWDGVSPTLRAGTIRGKGQFMAPRPIHPTYPRCITTREAARLHSFPDWFEFYPTKWYGMMQIGNSVPPFLGENVGRKLLKLI